MIQWILLWSHSQLILHSCTVPQELAPIELSLEAGMSCAEDRAIMASSVTVNCICRVDPFSSFHLGWVSFWFNDVIILLFDWSFLILKNGQRIWTWYTRPFTLLVGVVWGQDYMCPCLSLSICVWLYPCIHIAVTEENDPLSMILFMSKTLRSTIQEAKQLRQK